MTLRAAASAPSRAAQDLPVDFELDPSQLLGFVVQLAPDVLRVAVILAISFLGYRVVTFMTRRLERDIPTDDPIVKRLREQRGRTIASLLNNVARVVIITLAGLTILGTFLRIELAPLLAGVGVFGLAISFGAQSLVKDIINGIFVLIEGQYAIGDVIRVGTIAGMVERITLRVTVLRDLHGVVHVIPNGEINTLSNLTKAWSRAVLDVRVAYREEVDRVIDVLREIGAELYDDAEWTDLLTEPPNVLGVENLAESGVFIRVVATTLPLKQWDVARELRRRIKNRFDAEGIRIPYPHLTFYWGDGQFPGSASDSPRTGSTGLAGWPENPAR